LNNFWTRTISGAAFIGILTAGIMLSQYSCLIIFFIISILSQVEFYKLIKNNDVIPSQFMGLITGCILFAVSGFINTGWMDSKALFVLLPLTFSILIAELFKNSPKPFLNIAVTFTGIIYAVLPFVLLTDLAFTGQSDVNHPLSDVAKFNNVYHPHIILGILILQWSSDTGQYLTGRKLGKNPLFKRISPKKTWEGFIGGFVFCLVISYILSRYFNDFTAMQWMIIAAIIVIFGALGDLVESMLKRSIDVKDSGTFMPGHGGVLDRFDALIGAISFVYFYIVMFC
jgi:phosphatidate cytidylyltransferase